MIEAASATEAPSLKSTIVIDAAHLNREALGDIVEGLRKHEIWRGLAEHDIRQRFRRSLLGPFWLTLSMGVLVAALALVFTTMFQQDVGETLPYISVGIIFWTLLTTGISDGTAMFIGSAGYIRNVPLPISVHLYRMIYRNLIIWTFNMAIYVAVLVWFRIPLKLDTIWFVPGFMLFVINMTWAGLAAGILSARYRDIPQVVLSVIQVVFFLTPVFWSVDALPNRPAFVLLNPFFHLLEVVRAPLLGLRIASSSWVAVLVTTALGIVVTSWLYRRAYARIAYWV